MKRYIKCEAELDDRFAFSFDEIEPEFWLNTTTEPAKIYLEDEYVIGNGAGMAYDVAIAVPYEDAHWQIMSDIEDSLERHMDETLDGSDYTFSIHNVSKYGSYPNFASVPEEVLENSVFYKAIIDVVPIDNVDMYGEYRIGAWNDEIEDVPFR